MDREIVSSEFTILPYQRQKLISAALGWMGGGNIPVRQEDQKGETAAEPFFEVRVKIDGALGPALVLHGLSGDLRAKLTPVPLLTQWKKFVQQQLQKRYQL